jgi:ribosomal protein L7/L12
VSPTFRKLHALFAAEVGPIDLTRKGARLDAIRLLRERSGLGLAEAKQLVDRIAA